jgi:hypothetical protein
MLRTTEKDEWPLANILFAESDLRLEGKPALKQTSSFRQLVFGLGGEADMAKTNGLFANPFEKFPDKSKNSLFRHAGNFATSD